MELQSVQRELRSVREEAKAAVTSRERLSQEVQTKQAQVCSLEGQLDSVRSLNNKLTQEVKRSAVKLLSVLFLVCLVFALGTHSFALSKCPGSFYRYQ